MNLVCFSDATVFNTGICSKYIIWCDATREFIIWTGKNGDQAKNSKVGRELIKEEMAESSPVRHNICGEEGHYKGSSQKILLTALTEYFINNLNKNEGKRW